MTENYDYSHDVSDGARPGSHMLPWLRTITLPHPGQYVRPRMAKMITTNSGVKLDADLAKGLTLAAQRRESIRRTVGEVPAGREMLRHLFGLNLAWRDRAQVSRTMELLVSFTGTIRLTNGTRA